MPLKEHNSKNNQSHLFVVEMVINKAKEKKLYTANHQERVAQLAVAIAHEMGLSEEQVEVIRIASLLHDAGKLLINKYSLEKPFLIPGGPFHGEDQQLLREHVKKGVVMLGKIDFPGPVVEVIHQHHEKLNGSGYPQELSGEEILLEAKILTVVDVVEAMASVRPYRSEEETPGLNAALTNIETGKGVLYDSVVVDVCLKLFREKGFEFEDDKE